jgi:hypothetical protein
LQSNAIRRDQALRISVILRHAGRSDGLAAFNSCGGLLVQGEELGEEVFFGAEGVGVEDGGTTGLRDEGNHFQGWWIFGSLSRGRST